MDSTTVRNISSRYIEIDYLRAYAVGMVIVLHIIGAYQGTSLLMEHLFSSLNLAIGVDIFFAISGFVIAKNLDALWVGNDSREGVNRAVIFYVRRFVRLWPAMAFWLVINVVCAFIFRWNGMWPDITTALQKLFTGLTYTADFSENKSLSVMGYFWSLSVEWQFYLALPILLIAIRSNKLRIALMLAAVMASVITMPGGSTWHLFRFDGIVVGILAYFLVFRMGLKIPEFGNVSPLVAAAFTAVILVALAVIPPAVIPMRVGVTISSVIAGVVVIMASLGRGYVSTFGARRFIAWMGSRSYSLYLCHFPCLLVGRSVLAHFITVYDVLNPTRKELWLSYAVIFGLIVLSAELTYRFIERPSHEASRRIGSKPISHHGHVDSASEGILADSGLVQEA